MSGSSVRVDPVLQLLALYRAPDELDVDPEGRFASARWGDRELAFSATGVAFLATGADAWNAPRCVAPTRDRLPCVQLADSCRWHTVPGGTSRDDALDDRLP